MYVYHQGIPSEVTLHLCEYEENECVSAAVGKWSDEETQRLRSLVMLHIEQRKVFDARILRLTSTGPNTASAAAAAGDSGGGAEAAGAGGTAQQAGPTAAGVQLAQRQDGTQAGNGEAMSAGGWVGVP